MRMEAEEGLWALRIDMNPLVRSLSQIRKTE
jgi:hypothetical protein